ncbi:hypothetical protein [Sinorhizobium sojae]|uniref:hypothetical protein n=1 Tax=Sinorhizobium sojae TaxID=716925 RepID=UPI0004B91D73|nr:hypothetical protein [Sinorhizobium sojae]
MFPRAHCHAVLVNAPPASDKHRLHRIITGPQKLAFVDTLDNSFLVRQGERQGQGRSGTWAFVFHFPSDAPLRRSAAPILPMSNL